MKRSAILYTLLSLLCLLAGAFRCSAESSLHENTSPYWMMPGRHQLAFVPDNSTISFFLDGNIVDTRGTVSVMSGSAAGTIASDGRLADPSAALVIRADDLTTGNQRRDRIMKTKYLTTAQHPEIAFSSTLVSPGLMNLAPLALATENRPLSFVIKGDLTLHGITRAVSIPLKVFLRNGRLHVLGNTLLFLKDFGIANPSWFIVRFSDMVAVEFHIELFPVSPTGLY